MSAIRVIELMEMAELIPQCVPHDETICALNNVSSAQARNGSLLVSLFDLKEFLTHLSVELSRMQNSHDAVQDIRGSGVPDTVNNIISQMHGVVPATKKKKVVKGSSGAGEVGEEETEKPRMTRQPSSSLLQGTASSNSKQKRNISKSAGTKKKTKLAKKGKHSRSPSASSSQRPDETNRSGLNRSDSFLSSSSHSSRGGRNNQEDKQSVDEMKTVIQGLTEKIEMLYSWREEESSLVHRQQQELSTLRAELNAAKVALASIHHTQGHSSNSIRSSHSVHSHHSNTANSTTAPARPTQHGGSSSDNISIAVNAARDSTKLSSGGSRATSRAGSQTGGFSHIPRNSSKVTESLCVIPPAHSSASQIEANERSIDRTSIRSSHSSSRDSIEYSKIEVESRVSFKTAPPSSIPSELRAWVTELDEEIETTRMSLENLVEMSADTSEKGNEQVQTFSMVLRECGMFNALDLPDSVADCLELIPADLVDIIRQHAKRLQDLKHALSFFMDAVSKDGIASTVTRQCREHLLTSDLLIPLTIGPILDELSRVDNSEDEPAPRPNQPHVHEPVTIGKCNFIGIVFTIHFNPPFFATHTLSTSPSLLST